MRTRTEPTLARLCRMNCLLLLSTAGIAIAYGLVALSHWRSPTIIDAVVAFGAPLAASLLWDRAWTR